MKNTSSVPNSTLRVVRKPGSTLWRVMRGPIVVGLTETRSRALGLRKQLLALEGAR